MLKSPLFNTIFGFLFVIAVLHFIANKFYFYWTIWWYDMMMHTISGFAVGMASIMLWQYFFDKDISIKKTIVISLLFTLTVGISWELFELVSGAMMLSDGFAYYTDTISDILLDISGGILGSLYAHKVITNSKTI